ncbi:hypothetical protein [Cumulibacter soli]|uniref:hypothetical protein n=1 Tax=Cumulibacter soli TaxID=2546344 RepID=UPI001067D5C1|nr:hypothetical protein [Cumulibacter soli]
MITIDAGVDQSILHPIGPLQDPQVLVTSDLATIDIPCRSVAGGAIVEFPATLTEAWPETTGTAVMTAIRDGERVEVGSEEVTVVRTSADRAAQRQAVIDAAEACEQFAASTPTPEQAIAALPVIAGYVGWIARYMLDRDLI